jgi:hypothetical protein
MVVEIETFKNMAFSMVLWARSLACVGHPLVNYVTCLAAVMARGFKSLWSCTV